jgi:hypothetical protein
MALEHENERRLDPSTAKMIFNDFADPLVLAGSINERCGKVEALRQKRRQRRVDAEFLIDLDAGSL